MAYNNQPTRTQFQSVATTGQQSTGPLRLGRRDPVIGTDHVHGGWWPYSRDLAAELPDLLERLFAGGYDVRRVLYGTRGWDDAPRQLVVSGRVVRLMGYYSQQAASLVLTDSAGHRRLDLLVVPCEASDAVADMAMAMAALDGDEHRIGEIVDHARLRNI